jgi:aminoglycoside phosphotransferase family enzyme
LTTIVSRSLETSVGIEAKVAFLKQPDVFLDGSAQIKLVETHISWVFLTDNHAYKLKKPVRSDFVDFRTIAARRRDCEEEVLLNRRLTPDVYLGTVPLTMASDGHLELGGKGQTVDWLVKMRRLPDDRMLDNMVKKGAVQEVEIYALVQKLSDYYRGSPPVRIEPSAYRRQLEENATANARELMSPLYGLSTDRIKRILAAQLQLLSQKPELFECRAREERIVEGHGDLRPEHVCLEREPKIIDCVEFNREFRIIDPADELAFLALECERLGGHAVSGTIFEAYRNISGDDPPEKLVDFYKSYRACLRAKLAALHLRDPLVSDTQKWAGLTGDYLNIAERYIDRFC